MSLINAHTDACADPKAGTGGPDPLKSQNIGFLRNAGQDPQKNTSYQASKQCLAIMGTPVKRWRADNGLLIVVFGPYLP